METSAITTLLDYSESASNAGLRYVDDKAAGYRRLKRGRGFVYVDKNGVFVNDSKLKERIRQLVIPPAWTDVWICRYANGHIQVTGRDAKRRKQYIYHTRWDEIRNTTKFTRIIAFGEALPLIRLRVEEDLKIKNPTRHKVMAVIIRLLELTLIRIGNTEYAKTNESYGLTTLQNEHLDTSGEKPKLVFKGKSGKMWEVDIHNRRLARLVRKIQELPGQSLFQYIDDDKRIQSVDSSDVNEYLQEIMGEAFTAKDFRTWGGTVLAAKELSQMPKAENERQFKKNTALVVKRVSNSLNNTQAICRKYYIHPSVFEAYRNGTIFQYMREAQPDEPAPSYGLNSAEKAVLRLLKDTQS